MLPVGPMAKITNVVELDERIADIESNLATIRRELEARTVPVPVRNWLLDFIAIAEVRLVGLRARRAQLQRQGDTWRH
jgi:hypothetical protein